MKLDLDRTETLTIVAYTVALFVLVIFGFVLLGQVT